MLLDWTWSSSLIIDCGKLMGIAISNELHMHAWFSLVFPAAPEVPADRLRLWERKGEREGEDSGHCNIIMQALPFCMCIMTLDSYTGSPHLMTAVGIGIYVTKWYSHKRQHDVTVALHNGILVAYLVAIVKWNYHGSFSEAIIWLPLWFPSGFPIDFACRKPANTVSLEMAIMWLQGYSGQCKYENWS